MNNIWRVIKLEQTMPDRFESLEEAVIFMKKSGNTYMGEQKGRFLVARLREYSLASIDVSLSVDGRIYVYEPPTVPDAIVQRAYNL